LAERDDVGEGRLVEPATPLDEFGAKIAEMRDRAATEPRWVWGTPAGAGLGAVSIWAVSCVIPWAMEAVYRAI